MATNPDVERNFNLVKQMLDSHLPAAVVEPDIRSYQTVPCGVPVCLLCEERVQVCLERLTDTRFGTHGEYSICECLKCGLEQISPVPSIAELKRLYESHYNFVGDSRTSYKSIREWFLFSRLYKLWLRFDGDVFFHGRKGNGRLLDIGCNEGRGLQLHSQAGFQVEGLELNENAAANARQRGFTVHSCLIEDFHAAQKYDVVVLSNVLEHTIAPRQMLLAALSLLRPKGQIWISCPNSRSWLRTLFGRHWINWHVPFHITHFSECRLRDLLEEVGFCDVVVRQLTPSLWVSNSIIAKLFAKPGRLTSELRNPLWVLIFMFLSRFLLFPLLWLGNVIRRGDCLIVTAKKA